jgi:hypothetical protein
MRAPRHASSRQLRFQGVSLDFFAPSRVVTTVFMGYRARIRQQDIDHFDADLFAVHAKRTEMEVGVQRSVGLHCTACTGFGGKQRRDPTQFACIRLAIPSQLSVNTTYPAARMSQYSTDEHMRNPHLVQVAVMCRRKWP